MKGAQSLYFKPIVLARYEITLKLKWKPENSSLLRQRSNKEMITNHKGMRVAKDGGD